MVCKLIIILITVCAFNMPALAAHDEKTLESLIFHDQEGCLEPEKTLESLKEYSKFSPRVLGEISLSDEDESRCEFKNIWDFLIVLDSNTDQSKTLKAYKEYHWNKRILACKDSWKKGLERAIRKLKGAELRLSESLRNNIKKDKPNFDDGSSYELKYSRGFVKGILSCLEENIGEELQQAINENERDHLYESQYDKMCDLCVKVTSNLRGPMKIYELLANRPKTNLDSDQLVLNWRVNYKICYLIVKLRTAIPKDLDTLRKSKYPKQSVGMKLFSCIGNCASS